MIARKTILLLAGIFILSAAFYISASTAFVALLLGFLFIPPSLMIGATLVQGASELSNELFKPEKESMVISV